MEALGTICDAEARDSLHSRAHFVNLHVSVGGMLACYAKHPFYGITHDTTTSVASGKR